MQTEEFAAVQDAFLFYWEKKYGDEQVPTESAIIELDGREYVVFHISNDPLALVSAKDEQIAFIVDYSENGIFDDLVFVKVNDPKKLPYN